MTALAQSKTKRVTSARYLARVRQLPCSARELGPCAGIIEAHHRTGAGLAIKGDDSDTMPLCALHHRDFHDSRGPFKAWVKATKRDWQRDCVMETRRTLANV